MILRSLRLVHFQGLPSVRLPGLAECGVVRVPLPGGAQPGTLVAALRFLLMGDAPVSITARAGGDDPGFSFVEAELQAGPGAGFSLFRGVDRHGTSQVSLREPTQRRVTGGAAAVSGRLAELIREPVDAWCERHLGVAAPVSVPPVPGPGDYGPGDDAPPAVDPAPSPECDVSRAALRAVQELRRSLRAERLRLLASRRHSELLEHGRRLRHERAAVARETDEQSAERDRVRTRLQRVTEYRDQLERAASSEDSDVPEDAVTPVADERPTREVARSEGSDGPVEVALITCAGVMFLALVLYSTAASGDPDHGMIQIGLSIGFVIAVASYLHVVSGRSTEPPAGDSLGGAARPTPDAESRARAWRDSLRARFADVGDPDAPDLPDELRRRLSALEARLSPLRARLERLDDAIAVFDVEVGRAARSLHEALPELGVGPTGLAAGTDVRAAVGTVHELGDAVYAAVIERDALLSEGTAQPGEARQALSVALDMLADLAGASAVAATCLRRVDSFACAVGDAPEEDQLADLLDAEIHALAAGRADAEPDAAEPDDADVPPPAPVLDGLVVLTAWPDGASDDDVAAHFDPAVQLVVGEPAGGPSPSDRVRRPGASHRRR